MKRVQIAVRDFALPVPRTGSIEVNSGYNLLPQGGDEVHREIQRKRADLFPGYRTEVKLSHSFEHKNHIFIVSGRMDGLLENASPCALETRQAHTNTVDSLIRSGLLGLFSKREPLKINGRKTTVCIEEIKTAFDARQLCDKLRAQPNHPYSLQLQTYAYIYELQNQVEPAISFHIGSYVTGIELDLPMTFDRRLYEQWLEQRLDELVVEAETRAYERQRREHLGASLRFPFAQLRPGQCELIDEIERVLPSGDSLMIQAPTGLGKTAAVMFPTLKDAMARGQKLIYVTPKNSQHHAAQDAAKRMQTDGHAIRTLTLTAKTKMCFKGEPICNPEVCEFARDYYGKVHANDLTSKAAEHGNMDADLFRTIGERYEVCPFELSLDSIPYADVVIGDYNYVFSPRSLTGRFIGYGNDDSDRPNLVVDEAHNLPVRAVEYYSPSISTDAVHACRERVESLPLELRMQGAALLQKCKVLLLGYEPRGSANQIQLQVDPIPFAELQRELTEYIGRYLQAVSNPNSGDPIIGLCRQWSEFQQLLDVVCSQEARLTTKPHEDKTEAKNSDMSNNQHLATPSRFFLTADRDGVHLTLKITCCDASAEMASRMKEFEHIVAFSATLKPFDYYRQLSGFPEDRVKSVEFSSPFPKEKRKLLVIPQVSTKFSDRARNYSKIAEAIQRILSLKSGNYFVFFPSFAFLRRVFDLVHLPGFQRLRQESGMTNKAVQRYIDLLRSNLEPTVIFAVQGGVFSEGVDYPGDMLIGVIIVGPALPGWDLQRELVRQYYEQKFGNGFDYAYTYPAMARVIQAAGRVIRSETDCVLIVLMDKRFTLPAYTDAMPNDWFCGSVCELVSNSIANDISSFWRQMEAANGTEPLDHRT